MHRFLNHSHTPSLAFFSKTSSQNKPGLLSLLPPSSAQPTALLFQSLCFSMECLPFLHLCSIKLLNHHTSRKPLTPCESSSDGKEPACNAGDPGSIPGLGRSPGEGHGNPLQYSCPENSMSRGAWRVTVQGLQRVGMTEQLTDVLELGVLCLFVFIEAGSISLFVMLHYHCLLLVISPLACEHFNRHSFPFYSQYLAQYWTWSRCSINTELMD